MDRSPTIAIAGAGLGGLTAALFLARAGFRVTLFERETSAPATGAGIQITPNAGHVLAALGLEPAIDAVASTPRAIVVRGGRSNRRIVTMPLGAGFVRGFGLPYRTIHRGDLHGILLEAAQRDSGIEHLPGHSVVEFASHPRGVTFLAETAAGDVEFRADALIAADGVRSVLRELVPGGSERTETQRVAWRAMIPAASAPPVLAPDIIGLWLGSAAHLVAYPVRSGKEFNLVAVVRAAESDDLATVRRRFRGWRRPLRELLAIEADWRRWPIATVDPKGAWSEGPVALLGDAAHAMAPFVAQGGAMALEDAAVLANEMTETPGDLAGAIARYERIRRPRVAKVFRTAETTADLYHMGRLTGAVRNIGMRVIGGRGLIGRYSAIYGWRPPTPNEKRRPEAAPEARAAATASGSGPDGSTRR